MKISGIGLFIRKLAFLKFNYWTTEMIFLVSFSMVLVLLAITMPPVLTGDGAYYFAMLDGIANNYSPAITQGFRESHPGYELTKMTLLGRDGKLYGWHFFAFPLLCLPAYKFLDFWGLDVLKAFQLTNSFFIIFTLGVVFFSRLIAPIRWFVAGSFLLSTATLYFQWTSPELFSASGIIISSIGLVEGNFLSAAFFASVSSLQNPSSIMMLIPVFFSQMLLVRDANKVVLLTSGAFGKFWPIVAVSSVSLLPFGWNYYQFSVANPIAVSGLLDYSNINIIRLNSFFFDLNQGLIIGLPLLIWAILCMVGVRLFAYARQEASIFRREDLLLIGFILMVLPTLAQVNFNSASAVFMRYAAWTGMVPLVWVAVSIGRSVNVDTLALCFIPGLVLQIAMALTIGGLTFARIPSNLQFMPWVKLIWKWNPHVYDPLPQIFYERLLGHQVITNIDTPTILKSEDGTMIRILSRRKRIDTVAWEVCGGSSFVSIDSRPTSKPVIVHSESGFRYVTGRLRCNYAISPQIPIWKPPNSMTKDVKLVEGWSKIESWGAWTEGSHSRLSLSSGLLTNSSATILFIGRAYVTKRHPEQTIHVLINGKMVAAWVVRYPDDIIEEILNFDASQFSLSGEVDLEFRTLNPSSPSKNSQSNDTRNIGFGLERIYKIAP